MRDRVGVPFGSDLAGAFKEDSPRFYRAILDRLGAQAQDVWVVDDRDRHLLAARAIGASTIKIGTTDQAAQHDLVVEALADLPAALAAAAAR